MSDAMKASIHPAAGLMPEMLREEFDKLKESIRTVGQREPIKILGGLVLDGRHRFRACCELEIEPITQELPADTDAISYVLAVHTRRDLTAPQRAMIAQDAAKMRRGRPSDKPAHVPIYSGGDQTARVPFENPRTIAKVGEQLGVSDRAIRQARQIAEKAPDVAQKVRDGNLSLRQALKITELPADQRAEVLAGAPMPKAEHSANLHSASISPDPDADPDAEPLTDADQLAEMVHLCEQQQIELELLRKVVESDDSMREAIAEIKVLRGKLDAVADRIAGAENAAAQARLDAQRWKNAHDRLLKKLK